MKMKTLLALAISGICAAGVANAHDHMAKPAGPSIEVKVQQLDPANGNKRCRDCNHYWNQIMV